MTSLGIPSTKLNLAISLLAAALTLSLAQPGSAQNVQRWIHPNIVPIPNVPFSAETNSIQYENETTYQAALSGSDVFNFFIDDVANIGTTQRGRDSLRTRIQIFKKYGTRIAVTDAGPNAMEGFAWNPNYADTHYCQLQPGICTPDHIDTLAEQSAIKTLWKILPIYDAGGTVSYIALDGAGIADTLDNAVGPNQNKGAPFTLEQSVDTLIRYIKYVHNGIPGVISGRPDIKFGLIIAMPNVKYNFNNNSIPTTLPHISFNDLDFYDILNTIVNGNSQVQGVRANGETLWFLHADSPYNKTFGYSYDYLERLLTLRDQTHGLNMRFGVMFNTETPSDSSYSDETLLYIQQYRNRTNGNDPDDFILISWYPYPTATFPECPDSDPACSSQYSFMNLVKKVANPNLYQTFWGYDHRHSHQLDADIFDWQGYLAHDCVLAHWVTQTFGNQQRFGAEWHWLTFGVNEGRRGSGRFGSRYYLDTNSDLAAIYGAQNYAAGIDHYFWAGRNEGRAGTDPTCPESAWGCGY